MNQATFYQIRFVVRRQILGDLFAFSPVSVLAFGTLDLLVSSTVPHAER